MADGDSIKRVKHGVPIYIDVRSCGLAPYACPANPDFGAIERVVRTLVQKTLKGGGGTNNSDQQKNLLCL